MKDLSDRADGSIGVQTGSMAATNTVSVAPSFGAPGSTSESVAAGDIRTAPDDLPAADDHRQLDRGSDSGSASASFSADSTAASW